jgi:hypothetical protein
MSNYDYKFDKIDSIGLLGVMDDLTDTHKQYIENKYQILNYKYKLLHDIGVLKNKILKEDKK